MEVMYNDDIRAFRRHPSRRTTRVRYDDDSNRSPTEPNQPNTEPTPPHSNQTHSPTAHQTHQPSNQNSNTLSHPPNPPTVQHYPHISRFDRFVVTNLDDLEVHQPRANHINPNSPTNDSLWENNMFMESDNDLDPPNIPTILNQIIQSEYWMPSEGSTLRFVDVDEGYRGWTNADIISMEWEPDAQCSMDCDDYQNFNIELFLVDNPEAYEDSSEPRWHGHSHFHVGESSGTATNMDEIQITTGILTRLEQAVPQETNWNQEIPNWQITHSRLQQLESDVNRSFVNPILMGIELMVYLSKSQSPGCILNSVQLLSQYTIQSMSLFLQQLVLPWLYDIHSTQNSPSSNPITNSLLGNLKSSAVEDITPGRTDFMEGLDLLPTQADIESRPTSPKRQRDEEDEETSKVNRRRLNQE